MHCQQDSLQQHKDGFNTAGFTMNVVAVEEREDTIVFSGGGDIVLPLMR